IISVLGAWLGWTLLAGELPFIVAKDGLFPKWFAKENKNGAPVPYLANLIEKYDFAKSRLELIQLIRNR
ncbi:hypothetical protein INO77_16195, partial [Staphylococcus aureus]|nr:hypothetical protein [Staphylococcus aureus]